MKSRTVLRILSLSLIALYLQAFGQNSSAIRFAVIGDYGSSGQAEADVAAMVRGWEPDFVITTGDNNYTSGSASTIDRNIGQYYHEFISPYIGIYGQGDTVNRFFPSLGNHDWGTPEAQPYLDYFALPGNERYYEFVVESVHFFCIDSDTHEPDGTSSSSIQGEWLRSQLVSSPARWKIVYFHHAPYSSGTTHGGSTRMRWPFQEWSATTVLSGHEHNYERIIINNFPYMVNGLGGRSRYSFGTPIPGSEVRYSDDYGAQLVTADDDSIVFAFYNRAGTLIDRYVIIANVTEAMGSSEHHFWLEQNYPNPFNPSTVIRFEIPSQSHVRLTIFDLLGREVATLLNNTLDAGVHTTSWNPQGVTSGVYVCRLQAGKNVKATKLMLLR